MSAASTQTHWISPEEYLQGELLSDLRHEYACGKVYAMAGSSVAHNRISGNLLTEFNLHLRGKPCEAFMNDMKIRMESGSDSFFIIRT